MKIFRPAPLLANPHVQTILGNLLPTWSVMGVDETRTIALADGDSLLAHVTLPKSAREKMPLVILAHGLGGSAESAYLRRVGVELVKVGAAVARLDLRGAGQGLGLARRLYSAACSDDVASAVVAFRDDRRFSALAVAGFSLGGSIVLKMLGERGASLGLSAAVAVAPPVDLGRCSTMLAKLPWYDAYYVRSLVRQVQRHEAAVPGVPRVLFPKRLSVEGFDELYTAPRWGYATAADYYRGASAIHRLDGIATPTLTILAKDDPFVEADWLARQKVPDSLEVRVTEAGGHMGYLGRDRFGGWRWAEAEIVHWLSERFLRQ